MRMDETRVSIAEIVALRSTAIGQLFFCANRGDSGSGA
jgi:hypothetical protein